MLPVIFMNHDGPKRNSKHERKIRKKCQIAHASTHARTRALFYILPTIMYSSEVYIQVAWPRKLVPVKFFLQMYELLNHLIYIIYNNR